MARCPADLYEPSTRPYRGLPERTPDPSASRRRCRWLASFMHDDRGYIDLEQRTLQPLDNPVGPRLSPMSQVRSVPYVSGLYSR